MQDQGTEAAHVEEVNEVQVSSDGHTGEARDTNRQPTHENEDAEEASAGAGGMKRKRDVQSAEGVAEVVASSGRRPRWRKGVLSVAENCACMPGGIGFAQPA
eukprot:6158893-Amphidinium_carterae.1